MNAPKQKMAAINQLIEAWGDLAADKSFAGMTLDDFKKKVQPSLDARTALAAADNSRTNARSSRNASDTASKQALLLVVNAIKGDPAQGEDSALYEACGYVPKSKRKSGLSRKTAKTAVTPTKPA